MSTTATRTEPKTTVEKPRLILTHGEKGGVGKTTVARIIADYLVSRDTTFRAFDAEGATGQLLRFHPEETDAVAVESAAAIAPVLDYLMEGSGQRLDFTRHVSSRGAEFGRAPLICLMVASVPRRENRCRRSKRKSVRKPSWSRRS